MAATSRIQTFTTLGSISICLSTPYTQRKAAPHSATNHSRVSGKGSPRSKRTFDYNFCGRLEEALSLVEGLWQILVRSYVLLPLFRLRSAPTEEITFYGIDGDEAENFIRTIRKR